MASSARAQRADSVLELVWQLLLARPHTPSHNTTHLNNLLATKEHTLPVRATENFARERTASI